MNVQAPAALGLNSIPRLGLGLSHTCRPRDCPAPRGPGTRPGPSPVPSLVLVVVGKIILPIPAAWKPSPPIVRASLFTRDFDEVVEFVVGGVYFFHCVYRQVSSWTLQQKKTQASFQQEFLSIKI